SAEALKRWDLVIEAWAESDLPLLCRTPNWGRGAEDVHDSGRLLTCADNTPAHWAFAMALKGQTPTLEEISTLFDRGEMPLAFAIKAAEKPRLKYARGGLSSKLRLNKDGWKVCHVSQAGLRLPGHPTTHPLPIIKAHFKRFMSPRNMFLVPLALGGLGETPQMIDAIRDADQTPIYL
ncbi:MAG: hypothetical protein VXZ00_10605, partial [Pseudomonadota bacterium]|nr:hypothetical protein [Pseudomonadota bacterium]